jgi:hypothetical protein
LANAGLATSVSPASNEFGQWNLNPFLAENLRLQRDKSKDGELVKKECEMEQ